MTDAQGWDPGLPGQVVRLRDQPGVQGVTTGRTRSAGPFSLAQIELGPNDRPFKRIELLEPVPAQPESIGELVHARSLGAPADLRRILVYEKLKGDLTNVFYSMEASNTEFFPHQFKSVLKFVSSPLGRILIADEVGLGKTVEAIYIWKELQAREAATRLLVVCPSMLRTKWQRDLQRLFSIDAEIVACGPLVDRLHRSSQRSDDRGFACITSLEGIRPPRGNLGNNEGRPRARLANLLFENPATDDDALIDLAIIDEAHYLRNPETQSHRLGRLLADAAQHLVMLSATPVQIGSENLFNLLRLLDPDEIFDQQVFDRMLVANRPLVGAQRNLWSVPPNLELARENLKDLIENEYFSDDPVLRELKGRLGTANGLSPSERVEIGRLLEGRSLIGQYITRSRKREVIEGRVERSAQVLRVKFTPLERDVYHAVSMQLREKSRGLQGISVFRLISRQRQMASSLVAALESWRGQEQMEAILWEDLGPSDLESAALSDDDEQASSPDIAELISVGDVDIGRLEEQDGKYNELRIFIRDQLSRNPKEKLVVFAFFRGTLKYLHRRLKADGIHTILMMGAAPGEKRLDRDAIIEEFTREEGPSVLLSSEVGSEGIDLQFCRLVVNYDLPWNPMRVEQRIGRVDRIGQKASRIGIMSLAVEDTIEDRILVRLYDRINLFKESIGDLEEILGEASNQLLVELFNPDLSEEEREKIAADSELAIENRRAQQDELESQAINLIGFSDYLFDTISIARERGRWLSPDELTSMVDDFFKLNFPGTVVAPSKTLPGSQQIHLSSDARHELARFIERNPQRRSALARVNRPIPCTFDHRSASKLPRDAELVDSMHPLIRWIVEHYSSSPTSFHPAVAIEVSKDRVDLDGMYGFFVHRWSMTGIRSDNTLAFGAAPIDGGQALDPLDAEALVTAAARYGTDLPPSSLSNDELAALGDTIVRCGAALEKTFGIRAEDFELENRARCEQQRTSAKGFTTRRIEDLECRIAGLRASGRTRPIRAFQGQITNQRELLAEKLRRIEDRTEVNPEVSELSAGVIRIVGV